MPGCDLIVARYLWQLQLSKIKFTFNIFYTRNLELTTWLMQRIPFTLCLLLLISTLSYSQAANKKTAATKRYPSVAGFYIAPKTVKGNLVKSLALLPDGRAALSNNPNPLTSDTTVQHGTYTFDAQQNRFQIHWEKGASTPWLTVQKDSTFNLTPDLTFKLYQVIDSVEYKDGKRVYD